MKVCYLIQSHNNPEQVCRLARIIKISSPNCQVLISHDFSTSYLDIAPLSDLSGVDLIKRNKPPIRSEYSFFEVYLEALDWLFEHSSDFDWLVYLSGQDYPTQPLSKFEEFLSNTEYDAFIQHWKTGPWHPQNRGYTRFYYQYYFYIPKWLHPVVKKISRINQIQSIIHIFTTFGMRVGVKSFSIPFNDNFVCYGNVTWCSISRKCLKYLKEFLRNNPKLVNYYKRTIAPEESIIATVLANNKSFNLCDNDMRYVVIGDRQTGHYKIMTIEDYPNMTNGNFYFARRFDPNSEILDLLDPKILS
ncbi:beta-1,6-N-acetylglucosaminyltransferase [Argonema antarcticum]|uniref:beta-1,6-N-acetylglucosaminyltransferase n=1 Tax=Argonema antarcticum TaxID=2942763 RepID=UPI002010C952|nr:beta-1,6-N-acetylglucosaminyltransferase [Argonema antarcticum]MCL1473004.1 hypothetical protein [Argonema antarcticum A004/B2]